MECLMEARMMTDGDCLEGGPVMYCKNVMGVL
jgi:hypothetical protein